MKTLKQPLTHGEEAWYLKRYQEGDQDARNILIEHNLRLVAHVARKYQSPEYDPDDLISIGIIGLIKAVMTFDPTKKSRLATYASRCIENELLMMFRSRKKLAKEISIYEKIGMDQEGRELCLMDILESEPFDPLEKMEKNKDIMRLYQKLDEVLSEREKKVIYARYGIGSDHEQTQREIAEKLGISRSYVSRIEKSALIKLRAAMS